MTTCIKCGRPVADGELFCPQCGLNLEQKPVRQARAPAGRMQTPPQTHPSAPAPQEPGPRTRWGVIAVLALIALASLGFAGWTLSGRHEQLVQLRLRESDLERREAELSSLQSTIDEQAGEIDVLDSRILVQQERIDALEQELSSAKSTASQSQYDATAQQAELERTKQSYDELRDQLEELEKTSEQLETEKQALTAKCTELLEQNKELTEKAEFMDNYVVFVEDDGSNLYHRYGCPQFAAKRFWAYSRKLAESYRFEPCPYCFD